MTSPKIKIFTDSQAVAEAFATDLFQFVNKAGKPANIALSGGSTPALLFDILARQYSGRMDWSKIHFWWGDERCVPPTDEQSNYKMTVDHLLSKIEIPEKNIHRIMGEWSPNEANKTYINEILKHLPSVNGWPVFDLIILGMGNDGHTASIFPHEINLLDDPNICAVATHPETGQKRISLTGKVINNAQKISFLITGKSKADRVSEIFNKSAGYKKLPSSHIQPVNGQLCFYFDNAAASGIKI